MRLRETVRGTDPTLATSVEAFWSDCALYFRFTCVDDYIRATMTGRDDPIYKEDVVEVFLSETGSLSEYKEFELSPTNVQFDARIRNDRGTLTVKTEWDAQGWKTQVYSVENGGGWTCVWEIPFAVFSGGVPFPGDVWLMNCYRIDRGKNGIDQYQAWSPTGAKQFHVPDKFGRLRFVK